MPTPPIRIVVTGASGQVGGELLQSLASLGDVLAPTRAEMDLTDPTSIQTYLRATSPHWIVNPAAYTAVDMAESEPELAHAINAVAPGVLGREAVDLDAKVIHFSTDYVFTGKGTAPWLETDPTGPLGVYGATKLAGEQALLASGAQAVVLRTSWVYGATGKNFLRTILNLARSKDELRIVADQHGAPTWSRDLARLSAHILRASAHPLPSGIYHAAGAGETTWAGFAVEAIRQTQTCFPEAKLAKITPIPSSEYPTPAARPANSRLNCTKLTQTFGYTMLDWHDSLTQVLAEIQ
jgi:dTDP-4-dehydrorhamnose reductase